MPHRSLGLDNLSKLPLTYRRLANAAVNGTVLDLQKFLGHCIASPFSKPKLFLPVFFANLDPAGIPSVDQLDFVSRGIDSPIARALLSLRALVVGRKSFELPEAASVDLWPRIWQWIYFLDTYREQFPEASDKESYALYVATILDLQTDRETSDLIDATPGVRVVVGRAWALFVGLDNCFEELGFRDVCRYLHQNLRPFDPRHISEVTGGIGSTTELASVIVRHLNHLTPLKEVPAAYYSEGILLILDKTDNNRILKDALLATGIVRALTSMLRLLGGTSPRDPTGTLNNCLTIMSRIFTTYPAPMCVPDALRAGILRAIITCAPAHPRLREHMAHLVREILPPALIYHSVILCVDEALVGVSVWGYDPYFKRLPLFADWTRLIDLAQERAKIVHAYDGGEYPSKAAWNNPKCDNIHDKRDMKCCAACHRLNYCSVECQSTHWRGGHRDVCARLRALRLAQPEVISTRDRSFMRVLARHDYIVRQGPVLTEQVEVLYECPDMPYYLLFDYTSGWLNLEILSIDGVDVPTIPNDYQAQWLEHISRAAESEGRMQVAIMRFLQDARARFRMISMHSPSADLARVLGRIADSVPAGTDFAKTKPIVREQVRGLRGLIDAIV
ncbi:hypothetical protein B0H16DRAFT_1890371 [Mycena metata]|uniref:MYND-type domain-containing protein n=1 Tax=Mycena metata TaxID=1033252 RepID=A0AAD7N120_9AGAR|nr:hypothetical protein B0H16DRAFT_1890371 [Mycena metata]